MAKPYFTRALFAFLVSTNVFLLTFFLGQGEILTLPTLLFSEISGGALDATAAGIALIVTLPGLVLLIVALPGGRPAGGLPLGAGAVVCGGAGGVHSGPLRGARAGAARGRRRARVRGGRSDRRGIAGRAAPC